MRTRPQEGVPTDHSLCIFLNTTCVQVFTHLSCETSTTRLHLQIIEQFPALLRFEQCIHKLFLWRSARRHGRSIILRGHGLLNGSGCNSSRPSAPWWRCDHLARCCKPYGRCLHDGRSGWKSKCGSLFSRKGARAASMLAGVGRSVHIATR